MPIIAMLGLRVLRGRERLEHFRERLGLGSALKVHTERTFWVHAASNGELTSARALLHGLLQRDPDLTIVVTTNSVTGRALAQGWHSPRLHPRLAPLDLRLCLAAFHRTSRVTAYLGIEGEIWPNRFADLKRRRKPAALVSARISQRSAERWTKLTGLVEPILRGLTLVSAQDAESDARLSALGVRPGAVAPIKTLKAAVTLPSPDFAELERLATTLPKASTVLAASTHEGEEEQVIAALRKARKTRKDLRLILAPRHPGRADAIVQVLTAADVSFAQRSLGERPKLKTDVYLADTLGEMSLWYALAGSCFVGGSFVPRGGHTPFEPTQAGCAVLHGPDTSNFAEAYAMLAKAKASIEVGDAAALGQAWASLTDADATAMVERAKTVLSGGEDLSELIQLILDRLDRASASVCD